MNEGYPQDWVKVVLMVSPRGEIHAVGGDRAEGVGDMPYIGFERIKAEQIELPVPLAHTIHSAQQEWVGLTDVEWNNIVNKNQAWSDYTVYEVACAVAKLVEDKLKEKNTKKG
jgi:hypothetical protein